jgi:hypothetical protein
MSVKRRRQPQGYHRMLGDAKGNGSSATARGKTHSAADETFRSIPRGALASRELGFGSRLRSRR